LAIGLAIMLIGACSASADKEAAERGVVSFHRMFDAGRYSEIYRQAAPEFRHGAPEEAAVNFMRSVHERLGEVRRTTEQGWRVNFVGGGNVVALSNQTEFALARGVETFTFRVNGGSAKLIGYHVDSPTLTDLPSRPPVRIEE